MDLKQIRHVMQLYKKAWEQQNPELLAKCFTPNGVYQESPLGKSNRGHKAIKKFWQEVAAKNTKNIKFTLGKCYVSKDGKTGFAEWKCTNDHCWEHDMKWRHDVMHGIMVLKMKENKITHLNEYWNTKSK